MQDKVTFEYAVIRYVPKVEREEFINVGVLLFSKRKKFVALKYQLNQNKLEALNPKVDIDILKNYLSGWEKICSGTREGGPIGEFDIPSRFRWLAATRSTVLQTSKTHSGLCSDPESTLNELFKFYVL